MAAEVLQQVRDSWPHVVLLLSLDAAALLRDQLGLAPFYSDSVRGWARVNAAEWLCPDPWSATSGQAVTRSMASLRSTCGQTIAVEVRKWCEAAFPGEQMEARLWLWQVLLTELVQEWDGERPIEPLQGPELVRERLRIRNFLVHLENLRLELTIVRSQLGSNWDTDVDSRAGEWFDVNSQILAVARNIQSVPLWRSLIDGAPAAVRSGLQCWATSNTAAKGLEPIYAELPPLRGEPR